MRSLQHQNNSEHFLRRNRTYFRNEGMQKQIEASHHLVTYLVRLRREGTIDNEAFNALITMGSALFVEAEVTERIDRILEYKMPDYLKELLL